jgi:hypothetical protein
MSDGVDAQIESLKEVWLTETDLSFLRDVEPSVLARIVAEVKASDQRTQDGLRALYESMAKTTRFVPNFLLNKLSVGLSPYVLARITENLEPKHAASLSKHYEPALLAEISLHISAELAAAIAAHTDIDTLAVITEALGKKGLSRRLGEISDLLEDKMLEKLTDKIKDPERLASVAAYMTRTDKVSRLGRRLDAKLRSAVVSVLQRQGHSGAAQLLGA